MSHSVPGGGRTVCPGEVAPRRSHLSGQTQVVRFVNRTSAAIIYE